MAQITILVDRFYAIRKLLIEKKYYTNRRKGTNDVFADPYSRQKYRRKEQQLLFKNDKRFADFFAWVFDLQKRLDASDAEFANLCHVSKQTISMWRNFDRGSGGHFPSKRQFDTLLRLEIVAQANVIIHKSINVNVKIPKRRIRIGAKYPIY